MEISGEDWKLIRAFDNALNNARNNEIQESISCFEGWSVDRKLSYMRGWQEILPEGTEAENLKVDIPDSVLCDVSNDDTAKKNYKWAVGHYLSWQYKGSDLRLEFGSDRRRTFVTRTDGTFIFYFKNKENLVGMVIDGQTGYVEGCITRVYQDITLIQERVLQFKRGANKPDYIHCERKHNLNFNGSYTKAWKIYKVELCVGKLRRVIDKVATYRPELDDEPSPVYFETLILYSAEAPRIRGVYRTTAKSLSPLGLGIEGLAVIRIPESEEPFVLNYKQLSRSALKFLDTKIFQHVPGTVPRNLFQILSSVVLLRRKKVYPTKFLMADAPPLGKEPDEQHHEKGTLYSKFSHGGERVYESEEWIRKLWKDAYSTKCTNLNKNNDGSQKVPGVSLKDVYNSFVSKYLIFLNKEPFDHDGWAHHNSKMSEEIEEVLIVTDHLPDLNSTGNQTETKIKTIEAVKLPIHDGGGLMTSDRRSKTGDTLLSDLTAGLATARFRIWGQIKNGVSCRSEGPLKYNQLFRIGEELGATAVNSGA